MEASLDRERVRRCLEGLTDVQRESITLAYYGGYSYRQVSDLLKVTLGAIKTRIRDGLIRMRDCLGVSARAETKGSCPNNPLVVCGMSNGC